MRLSQKDSLFHVQRIQFMNIEELYRIFIRSTGICTDSRNIIPGAIFFAIRGEKFDGNKFARDALQKGCAYSVVDDKSLCDNPRLILVENVLEYLQQLANHHRKQLKIPLIALTGSNGKTTTKELCQAILARKFKVASTLGNLNNHIGVPLTILSIKDEEISIVEMGANHVGEIDTLCSIAKPGFGLITNIGLAHLEGFGSPEGVRRGKAELYDFLKNSNGKAFYNASDPVLSDMIRQHQIDPIPYGEHPESICRGQIHENKRFLSVELSFGTKKIKINTRLIGSYNLENIIAASAVGKYFGVNNEDIKSAVENYSPSNNRSQYLITHKNKIIMDAYNANPTSMKSSILNFLGIKDTRQKLLILGDMLELGPYGNKEHDNIISLLKEKNCTNVYLVGPSFLKSAGNSEFRCFEKVEDLIIHLQINEIRDRLIFLKGSRAISLEKLIDSL